jgi:hypothetical protein
VTNEQRAGKDERSGDVEKEAHATEGRVREKRGVETPAAAECFLDRCQHRCGFTAAIYFL